MVSRSVLSDTVFFGGRLIWRPPKSSGIASASWVVLEKPHGVGAENIFQYYYEYT